ncbi:Protein of unknown function [Pyronema omphalodes CBS 100304]|uniref:Uncharacterized protein n=1 Tax=Pyronema omphalodes (strain CBS 100304) TaxID=1076935 RepID=U4KYK0_PYROM|nr:Protein of unknown function [Pyronema omphalodes CBS 100304]
MSSCRPASFIISPLLVLLLVYSANLLTLTDSRKDISTP